MSSSTKCCSHKPTKKILYDIANNNTEELLLCDQCYSSDESFSKWILKIEELEK